MKLATRTHDFSADNNRQGSSIIKNVTLPYTNKKGFKIQARSLHIYNAIMPTREQVRKENYDRRYDQMASMGFRTPINVPYRIIGEPINLESREFELHDPRRSVNVDSKIKESSQQAYFLNQSLNLSNKIEDSSKNKSEVSQAFTYKNLKKNKELISLQVEVKKTKNLIKQVKLGHSLFDLLRKEEETKIKKLQVEKENSTASMQLRPMIDSDCEYEPESDDELLDAYTDNQRTNDNYSPETNSVYNQFSPTNSEFNRDGLKSSKTTAKIRILADEDPNGFKETTNTIESEKRFANKLNRPQTVPMQYNHQITRSHTVAECDIERNPQLSSSQRAKTSSYKKMREMTKPYTPVYSSLLSKDETFLMDKNLFHEKHHSDHNERTDHERSEKKSEKTEQEKLAIIEKKWQSFLREKVNKGDSDKNQKNSRDKYRHRRSRVFVSKNNLNESLNLEEIVTDNNTEVDSGDSKLVNNYNNRINHHHHHHLNSDQIMKKLNETTPSSIESSLDGDELLLSTTANNRQFQFVINNYNKNSNSLISKNNHFVDSSLSLNDLTDAPDQDLTPNSPQPPPLLTCPNHHQQQLVLNSNSNTDHQPQSLDMFLLTRLDTNRESVVSVNFANNNHLDPCTAASRDYFHHHHSFDTNNPAQLFGLTINPNLKLASGGGINLNASLSGPPNDIMTTITTTTTNMSTVQQQHHHHQLRKKAKSASAVKNDKAISIIPQKFSIPEHELELLKIGNEEDMERILNKIGNKEEKRNSKNLKADTGPIHALWTPEVLEFQKNLPSVAHKQHLQEIKDQFDNVADEKTVEIHKRLEELIKKRMTSCMVKFSSVDLKQRGIHNILDKMNRCLKRHEALENSKNAPTPKYYQWYIDLEYLIENYYNREDIVLAKLLDKLAVYGKLNAKKQNELSFFRVLDSLKTWEFLSPDVMSAIEFCREKILEIQIDDFEEWFKTKRPDYFIPRSATSAVSRTAESQKQLNNTQQ